MSFEIEDVDDSYDFQSKWSKPSKSYFGAHDNDEGDEYNFDFGKPKSSKKSKSPPWKAETAVKNSYNSSVTTIQEPIKANSGNIMDKAADLLKKYQNPKAKSEPTKRSKNTFNSSREFNESDLMLDSSNDSPYLKNNKFEMSFSLQAEQIKNPQFKVRVKLVKKYHIYFILFRVKAILLIQVHHQS